MTNCLPASKLKFILLVFVTFTFLGVLVLVQKGNAGTLYWQTLIPQQAKQTQYAQEVSDEWDLTQVLAKKTRRLKTYRLNPRDDEDDEAEADWMRNDGWASTTTESSMRDFRANEKSAKPLIPDLETPEKLEFLRARFLQRSRLLREKCSEPSHHKAASINNAEVKMMKVAYSRLHYCPVPKIGTTFTRSIERRHFSDKRRKSKRKPEKSYFLVREPYSRLMSGYIGKVVTNQPWWRTFGQLIIGKFRPGASEKVIRCGNGATFPEFVKYLIYSQESSLYLNTHFQPIHQQCRICNRDYDFVGHLETLSDDMSFMLSSVNITGKDLNFDDSEGTIRGKCRDTVKRKYQIKKCQDMCSMMKTVWWSFHARGLISKDIELPVKGSRCDTVTGDEFAELAMRAHNASLGNIERSKQKRGALVELFAQVPLQDRLRLRELYLPDFELFGYDSMPPDLFPEVHQAK